MKWTVVWTNESENELADIWQRAEDRASVTLAAHRIEQDLKRQPTELGEDYYGDWIVQSGPLAVAYWVSPGDRLVRVIQVMRIKG